MKQMMLLAMFLTSFCSYAADADGSGTSPDEDADADGSGTHTEVVDTNGNEADADGSGTLVVVCQEMYNGEIVCTEERIENPQ